jgi:serine protease
VQDPSVEAPPAAVVDEAAPDADEDTLLRVVTVLNRGGEPTVLVERVRGPSAAAETVGEAQDSDDVVAVAVDTRVTLDAPAAVARTVRADSLRTNQWALDRLGAEKVWSDYSSGAGSVVAVIDTGVDGGHPDLTGQLTTAGIDYVTGSGDGRVDPHGHGSHVAGVVAAVRGNAIGIAGLAPLARVMPIRVLDSTGAGWSSNIAKGIIYATDNGADVINLSLGGPSEDSATKVAVNYAMSKGVIVVAAAGNSRATDNATNYPAAYPGVLAVASTELGDTSSTFSNTGTYVDVAAPGGRILSTVPGGYAYMSGTSMATPYVAATAALVADLTGGTVTTEQFEKRVTVSAWDLGASGWDAEFGHGLVNPYQSLCSFSTCGATQTPVPTPTPTPSPTPTSGSAPAPGPAPAPEPAPTETMKPSPSPSPTASPSDPATSTSTPTPAPRSTASPGPTSTTEPPPAKRRFRLAFTAGGGTATRGQRVPIRLRVTDAGTGRPVVGHRVLVRGWRNGSVAVRRWISTDNTGRATARLPLPATTRFDLRSPTTETTRPATSSSSIHWRIR